MAGNIYVGSVGVRFKARIMEDGAVVDISTATGLTMNFRKPDGTIVSKPAQKTSGGADGYMHYDSETGFLDTEGTWHAQPHLTLGTWTGPGDPEPFDVAAVSA